MALSDEELKMAMAFGRGPLTQPLPEASTMDNMELAHAIWAWLIIVAGPFCIHLYSFTAGFESAQGFTAGFESMQAEKC